MNLAAILADRARELGEAGAIVDRHATVSFAALDRAAGRAAAAYTAAGLAPGDRVLLLAPMSPALYALLAGLFRIGATAMAVDVSAGWRGVERACALAGPRGVVSTRAGLAVRLVSPVVRRIPLAFSVDGFFPGAQRVTLDRGEAVEAIAPCAADTPALLTFTSGSTGAPKGVVRTHGFLLAQQRALARALSLEAGRVDLTTLPVFVLANLAAGVTSLIADADLRRPGAVEPAPLIRQIDRHRPSSVVASPAFLGRLAAHAVDLGRPLDSFERIFTGGGPVFPALLDTVAGAAPRARVVAVYGSTEAEPIAHVDWRDVSPADREATRGGAGLLAGPPVGDLDLRVIPDRWGQPIGPFAAAEFDAAALPAGHPGEIVVAGDRVVPGYLDGAGDAETKFRVAGRPWHRTGDAGYLDRTGRLWLLGRCAARVADRHGIVYPFAVEGAASEVAGVRRTALVPRGGGRGLLVELDVVDPEAAMAALGAALAWASLDEVRVVPRIPVDPRHNAKVDYRALRALAG